MAETLPGTHAGPQKKGGLPIDPFAVLAALLGGYVAYAILTPAISCLDDQPLVINHEDFMDTETFGWMQDCLANHPLTAESSLDPTAFHKTKGFVIAFNRHGKEQFKKDQRFKCLVPYFDKVLQEYPDANAFIMNLLVCHMPTNESDVVVGMHVDSTLETLWPGIFFAHQVNVLYVVVPDDMTGGHLQVFNYSKGNPGESDDPSLIADKAIQPKENSFVAFRGDSYHRVMGYRTQTQHRRISLVLEQYRVPDMLYPFTKEFYFFHKDQKMM